MTGATPMAGPRHLDSAAPLCQYWWRWWGSAGLSNHSTWMRPLQGGGLWAPANRAERLRSRVRHSAICRHRPPRLQEGTRTPPHPGMFAGEVAASFSPCHANPLPSMFTLGQRIKSASGLCSCRSVFFASNGRGVFPNAPPVSPILIPSLLQPPFCSCVTCAFVRIQTKWRVFSTPYSRYCAISLFPTFPPRLTCTHLRGCVCTPNTSSPGAHSFSQ